MKRIFLFCLSIISIIAYGQEIAVGQWRDHLPYGKVIEITEDGKTAYCVTKAGAVFSYNRATGVVDRLNTVSGLSGVNASAILFDGVTRKLIIGYQDGNIDIIKDGLIINLPDLARRGIGDPSIRGITSFNKKAYLSTGFGVLTLDLESYNFLDTYYLRPGGNAIPVNESVINNNYIFSATDSGVFVASLAELDANKYNPWIKVTGLASGIYNTITSANNKVYVSRNAPKSDLYEYDGTTWTPRTFGDPAVSYNIRQLRGQYGYLSITVYDGMRVMNSNFDMVRFFPSGDFGLDFQAGVFSKDEVVLVGSSIGGLLVSVNQDSYFNVLPTGPTSSNVYDLDAENGMVVSGSGGILGVNGLQNYEPINYLYEGLWRSIDIPGMAKDISAVEIHPTEKGTFYASSYYGGLVEVRDFKFTQLYDHTNSGLENRADGSNFMTLSAGAVYDADGNLWVTNAKTITQLAVLKPDGTWKSFSLQGALGANPNITRIYIDQLGQKWIVGVRTGIAVYNDNGTLDDPSDDKVLHIDAEHKESLPSNEVNTIAIDKDGAVWVGTNAGLVVYPDPAQVFDDPVGKKILITQNGITEYLLDGVVVTDIKVDESNKKWIATGGGGVFYISEDGTAQLKHFTARNSPLFSDVVMTIAIESVSGEVFFGTTKGIISYKGTVTKGNDEFTDVYAYPNPVPPGYEGLIAVKGLVSNVDVRITDVSGTLIYQAKAEGGQVVWDGHTLDGRRAASGIYLVFSSNDDGSKRLVTKILVMN